LDKQKSDKETQMESSIKLSEEEQKMLAEWQEPDWDILSQSMSVDLDVSARKQKAIIRERKLKGAKNLLRMALAYAVCDWSLRLVAAWGTIQGIASLSDVGVLYRLCESGPWLGWLVGRVLQHRNEMLCFLGGVRLRLVDATVISRPGSQGTDWRVHLSYDLGRMCLDGIEITDAKGGESLARFEPRADEIYIADRGYCAARGLGTILATCARLVVRVNWHNLLLKTELGHKLNLIQWLEGLSTTTERIVTLSTPQGDFQVRLIAYPLPADKDQQAREKVAKQARKKGVKKLSHSTWLAAGFVILITNLPAHTWETSRIIHLYRLRWQIEIQIKRLKSLLHLDHLRAQDPRLVQTYLLAKLLAALLLDQLVHQAEQQAPDLFQSLQRPVSLWRLHALLLVGLRQAIIGHISLLKIMAALPSLHRYLCDTPRIRSQQLSWARRFLVSLYASGI
jgi:hypothetical protein